MPETIYRAADLHNVAAEPAERGKPAKPARRGIFNVGKSHFWSEIAPKLDRVRLGEGAIGYTESSVERLLDEMIEAGKHLPKRKRA